MSTQDEVSFTSSTAPSAASILNKVVKVVALAHRSYVCDQLGGRTAAATQLELCSERKKHQGCSTIERDESFESMLERVRNKARFMPTCRGPCTCLVDNDGPTIVENNANAIQHVMRCADATKPSVFFVLTTCQ